MGDLPEALERIAADVEDNAVVRKVPGGERCDHAQGLLHPGLRKLTCRECSCDLDAYDFLLRMSRDTDIFRQATEQAERRASQAEARLANLLRQERNAKARARRRRQT